MLHRVFFVMKYYKVCKSVAYVLKCAPNGKVVVVGRRQSKVIHIHSKIYFLWLQLIRFLLISRVLLVFQPAKFSNYKADGINFSKDSLIQK